MCLNCARWTSLAVLSALPPKIQCTELNVSIYEDNICVYLLGSSLKLATEGLRIDPRAVKLGARQLNVPITVHELSEECNVSCERIDKL